jgi:two-component system cell cycle sensor histidine kinase/response regulator CckA
MREASRREHSPIRFSTLLVLSGSAAAVASVLLFVILWALLTAASLRRETAAVREQSIQDSRELIRSQAEQAVAFIQSSRASTRERLKSLIRDRVYEAHAVAEHLHRKYQATMTEEQLREAIREALRPVRFNKGRGYFFAIRQDGLEELFADRPDLEGLNLLQMRDTEGRYVVRDILRIARQQGEGFYSYTWTKPGHEGRGYLKLAYVMLCQPLGWVIGTGEYLDDFERDVQEDILAYIQTIRFGNDGYVFAGRWDGVSLSGPGKGQNMIGTTDSQGVQVVRELIRAAQAGGGYVQYVMPPLEGQRQLPKLSYSLPIPDLQWYVGAGIYLEDLEKRVAERRQEVLRSAAGQSRRLAVILLVVMAGVIASTLLLAHGVRRELAGLAGLLSRAATHADAIKESALSFLEFRGLARSANDMLRQRAAAEADRVRLATAIEQSQDIFMVTDVQTVIEYVNPVFESVTGYSRQEAIGRMPDFLDSHLRDPSYYEQMHRTIRSGRVWLGTFTNRRKDQSLFEQQTTICPVRDGEGRIVNYVALMRDITEQVRLERQLAQAQKMEAVGQLAGGIAHDFNNLLQVIQGFATLAAENTQPGEPNREHLGEVLSAADRAAELVRRLLAFSRREAFRPAVLDLNALIAEAGRLLRRLIGEHLELDIRSTPDLRPVLADAGQMEQVLINLCVNARDAMPSGGRIGLSTRNADLDARFCAANPWAREGQYACLEVADTGTGIAPEHREHIFEPFFTTKGPGRGTGLGLATVYGVVRQHSGLIQVESETGRGTVISVYLPVTGQRPEAPAAASGPRAQPGEGETVLLAEDDEQVRRLAVEVLTRAGYRVRVARDGEEAEARFLEAPGEVRLAVLDVVMPRGGGREVAERLRRIRPDLPVLFASGYSPEQLPESLAPGHLVLDKPYRPEELLARVRQLLDKPE